MEVYRRWIRSNKDFVHSLESLANGLTWLFPERFSESEIAPEAVTAILGIIVAINEHIIGMPQKWKAGEPGAFPHSLCISSVKELESLVEVAAHQVYGEEKKWIFLAVIEAVKVSLRLAILCNCGYRMLLRGGEILNVEEENNITPSYSHQKYRMSLHALRKFGADARLSSASSSSSDPSWLQRVQQHYQIPNPQVLASGHLSLSKFVSEKGVFGALFVLGEAFCITRPLIYVLLIRKYGVRSWIPWFISFTLEFSGVGLVSLASHQKQESFLFQECEKNEMKRRKLLWALYLMRDPFFSKYTRGRLRCMENITQPIPIIGFFTAKIIELLVGVQTRYTYTSGA